MQGETNGNNDLIAKIDGLSFSYGKNAPVLNDVSFSLRKGKYVSLIGHNGSGKSTIAKILMGLLPNFEGSIELFGLPLNKENVYAIRAKEGIVFQNPDNQFVGSTVEDDIAFGLENRNFPSAEIGEMVRKYASAVGMEDFLTHEPEKLSGGQKQRVAIAGILAMGPDLMIFDEATSMLDPKGKKEVAEVITSLRKGNPSLTLLSITHDVEEAYLSDHVVVLAEGKVLADGSPKEVFENQSLLDKAKLKLPFLLEAKAALRQNGIEVSDKVSSIEELGDYLW
jgi:energy-coupling factor transport system ATP-binding protein